MVYVLDGLTDDGAGKSERGRDRQFAFATRYTRTEDGILDSAKCVFAELRAQVCATARTSPNVCPQRVCCGDGPLIKASTGRTAEPPEGKVR